MPRLRNQTDAGSQSMADALHAHALCGNVAPAAERRPSVVQHIIRDRGAAPAGPDDPNWDEYLTYDVTRRRAADLRAAVAAGATRPNEGVTFAMSDAEFARRKMERVRRGAVTIVTKGGRNDTRTKLATRGMQVRGRVASFEPPRAPNAVQRELSRCNNSLRIAVGVAKAFVNGALFAAVEGSGRAAMHGAEVIWSSRVAVCAGV